MSEKLTLNELKSHLWASANLLRGKIDSSDFKNYIFGLLFYKRLSDTFDEEKEKLVAKMGNKWQNSAICILTFTCLMIATGLMCLLPVPILEKRLMMSLPK